MLENIVPREMAMLFDKYVEIAYLSEIRMRINQPIILNIANKIYSINYNGLCGLDSGIICDKELIEKTIYIATENSLYASTEQIKQGFITAANGVRVGIGGQFVYNGEQVDNITNISSINIRVPHEVVGCSKNVMEYIYENEKTLHNTLILSAPGVGKTTLLRDIIHDLSNKEVYLNSLVIDERFEISGAQNYMHAFDLGQCADVLYGSKKAYGLSCGIRSMSPNVVFTDEIASLEDQEGILYACNCGVKVVATMHALNLQEYINKTELLDFFKYKVFTRYIVLSKRRGNGTIEGVYDNQFKLLYRD